MRLINADLLVPDAEYDDGEFWAVSMSQIENAPTIESELIRCKDCRHWREQGLCGIWDQYISNEDFYCGCAERKEGD